MNRIPSPEGFSQLGMAVSAVAALTCLIPDGFPRLRAAAMFLFAAIAITYTMLWLLAMENRRIRREARRNAPKRSDYPAVTLYKRAETEHLQLHDVS
jgi:hypothetical protein